jgi:hypothetical protein
MLLVHPFFHNRDHIHPQPPSLELLRGQPAAFIVLVAEAIVFGVAWWVIWKGKRSARGGIAASLAYIRMFFQQLILPSDAFAMRSSVGQVGALIVGLRGIVVFSIRQLAESDSTIPDCGEDLTQEE